MILMHIYDLYDISIVHYLFEKSFPFSDLLDFPNYGEGPKILRQKAVSN